MAADAVEQSSAGDLVRVSSRSGWAIAALFCSLAILCPVLTVLGPILGLRALVQISANPSRTGRGMAWTAIVVGLAATSAWISFALWWNVHARPLMLRGPADAIIAAYAGDLQGFRQPFSEEGQSASNAEAAAFIQQLQDRYGAFIDSAQTPDGRLLDTGEGPRARGLSYLLRFERGSVEGIIELRMFLDGLRPRLGYLHVRDPALGDLVFPASAANRAQSAKAIVPATQPFAATAPAGPPADAPPHSR